MVTQLEIVREMGLKPAPVKMESAMPSAINMEEAVIGGILFDPNAIERVPNLEPDHFYFSTYGLIYKAAVALYHESKPTDLFSVAMFLQERGLLDKVGGQSELVRLSETVVTAANIDHYAEVLIKKWRRRKIIMAAKKIVSLSADEAIEDDDLQSQIEDSLLDLFDSNTKKQLTSLQDILTLELEEMSTLQEEGRKSSIPTGFYDLDETIGGLNRGELTIVAGRPSMGKSAFIASMARNLATTHPVAIFSLEMANNQIARRILASETSIDSARLKDGTLDEQGWDRVYNAVGSLYDLPIWMNDAEDISVTHIRSQVRKLKAQNGDVGVVMIDYLHLMLDGGDEETRELGKITRQLKKLARELNVAIILLSQLNRAVESRSDKRPMMSDLRQSGAIEQDADMILMLYRDEYYNKDSSDRGICEVIIAKNRDRTTGTVKMLFEAKYSRFRSIATGDSKHVAPVKKGVAIAV